ncbi:Flp pilus assembly protein CpaB [Thalassotalea euphylliae]|uniref:Flp pilus assembly protein CpaB n=1 Tax=Thalassotalea euphylliae TaxID=1655234 RepID=A0A3E0TN69_9GAMM|nr:Flp pilus assembly protein CpaB [Thalassotalea euphylliae]REL25948.1 Flp pilus assembly protein CpaB [Thalassotalea euphylliae]
MLNRRIIYFTLLLTALGIVGIYWQLSLVSQSQPAKPVVQAQPQVSVLTVSEHIPAGQAIQSNQLSWQPISAEQAATLVGVFSQSTFNSAAIDNALAAYPLAKGEFLRSDAIVLPSDSEYLALTLAPNKRGIALKVDAQSAIAGLVNPGDHVDVLFYHKLGRSKKDFSYQVSASARKLVSNVKLLAVDRTVSTLAVVDEDDKSHASNSSQASHQNRFNEHSTVTVEVSSEQAGQLLIAQQLGQLSLALVSKHLSQQLSQSPSEQQTMAALDTPVAFEQMIPELGERTEIVNLLKGDHSETLVKNESLMLSTKLEQTGGDDNVF